MTLAFLEQKGTAAVKQWIKRRREKHLLQQQTSCDREFLEQIALAKQSLSAARENFNFATDDAMTDYYIYMIKAEETKLNYFLSLAKKENRENPSFFTPRIDLSTERGCG